MYLCQIFNLIVHVCTIPGLPKAAIITHRRAVIVSCAFRALGVSENDIMYTALPLYHTAGSMLGLGSVIEAGK